MNLGTWIVVGVVVLLLGWFLAVYNRFVALRQQVKESWAGIDVELKRRYELIPNLVATVKGYAQHEREVLDRVLALRERAVRSTGSATSQAVDENALLSGMRQLFAVVENYPQLKADAQFLALQQELGNTEDRIAAARRFYNGNVRAVRTMQESFPTSMVAGFVDLKSVSFFELLDANERVVPRVDLGGGKGS